MHPKLMTNNLPLLQQVAATSCTVSQANNTPPSSTCLGLGPFSSDLVHTRFLLRGNNKYLPIVNRLNLTTPLMGAPSS